MNAQASEIMITPPYKAKETDTVKNVIEKFVEHRISGLPVVNDLDQIVGYISDGDIMRYIGKHKDIVVDFGVYYNYVLGDQNPFDLRSKNLDQVGVMDIAQRKVIKVQWDEDIEDIAALLGKKNIKKVPVEQNGRLAGVISRGDIIRFIYRNYLCQPSPEPSSESS
ncbi:CBS domain-containing protein [Cohnella candidum]|uniref:CBS domain-containing protein n=1 Tax=Cohnella candidum TaxID=2674991 RepID=A0A3G3JXH8_9BACL|nr:CBS domain-containing protein [Cohnella candidum]AYQ72963.1 CBS domain-containing protein [Cohnella candidum]